MAVVILRDLDVVIGVCRDVTEGVDGAAEISIHRQSLILHCIQLRFVPGPGNLAHIASRDAGWGHNQRAILGCLGASLARLRYGTNQGSNRSDKGDESEPHVENEIGGWIGI